KEYAVVSRRFGLDQAANFEGLWHFHVYKSTDEAAQESGVVTAEAETLLGSARKKLLAVRNRRVWPGRDEKVLTSWNALAIRGLAFASRSLNRADLSIVAQQAVDFIEKTLWRDGRLLAVYKDQRARFAAYLDDYAYLLDALVELLQTQWRSS